MRLLNPCDAPYITARTTELTHNTSASEPGTEGSLFLPFAAWL